MSESVVTDMRDAEPEPDRGRGLLAYVLLAYGLSWAWLVPLAVTGLFVQQGQGWPSHFPPAPLLQRTPRVLAADRTEGPDLPPPQPAGGVTSKTSPAKNCGYSFGQRCGNPVTRVGTFGTAGSGPGREELRDGRPPTGCPPVSAMVKWVLR